jgi:hypothetical protein
MCDACDVWYLMRDVRRGDMCGEGVNGRASPCAMCNERRMMRCDAMRCDAMRCDAMRCDAMRCDAMRAIRLNGMEWDMVGAMRSVLGVAERMSEQMSLPIRCVMYDGRRFM